MSAQRAFPLLLSLVFFGCSGADTQDVLAQSGSTTTTPGTTTNPPGATPPNGTTPTNPPPGTSCTQEREPNNSDNDANTLADGTTCGTVSAADPKDFVTFKLKKSTKTMSITFSGSVRLRVTVNNQTTDLTPGTSGKVPFVSNQDYVVEVTALDAGASSTPWTITLTES